MTKSVLIVGGTSYIARQLVQYVATQQPETTNLQLESISARGTMWEDIDFSLFNSIVFTAGIAHRKQTSANAQLYDEVNRDLAWAVANKAKQSGCRQMIYLSSMAVYGVETGVITDDTPLAPASRNHYALSKYQAEQGLVSMAGDGFQVVILRPPLVYGPDCPGKYNSLIKIAKYSPVLPTYANARSMVHIKRLSQLMVQLLGSPSSDNLIIRHPRDPQSHDTSQLLFQLAQAQGRRPLRLPLLNLFIKWTMPWVAVVRTAFGDLTYETTC